ncbi:MAG: CHAD domain-containing protein [Planctomycetota bacterium]
MTPLGRTQPGDASPPPGAKWFAAFAPEAPGLDAARALLSERRARYHRLLEQAADDPTGKRIRKLRVATRRLDAAYRFASPLLASGQAKRRRAALRLVRQAGGRVRRCDLFLERLSRIAEAEGGSSVGAATSAVIGRLAAVRHEAMAELLALLRDPARAGLTDDRERSHAEPLTSRELARRSLREAGDRFLAKAGAPTLETEPLHDLRLAGKKLRYAVEVAAPVTGDEAAGDLIRAVVPLQNELGTINDLAELADELSATIARLAAVGPGAAQLAAGAERLFLASAAERDRRLTAYARSGRDQIDSVRSVFAAALKACDQPEPAAPPLRLTDLDSLGTA